MDDFKCAFCKETLLQTMRCVGKITSYEFVCSYGECYENHWYGFLYHLGKMESWHFKIDKLYVRNDIKNDYCYCSKNIGTFTKYYITMFETPAWDVDPLDKEALIGQLNLCLAFS